MVVSDPDPRNITPDQAEVLTALEAIALLPVPIQEDDFEPLADHALDLLEARGGAIRGAGPLTPADLVVHERGLRQLGHGLAADGVQRLLDVLRAGYDARAALN